LPGILPVFFKPPLGFLFGQTLQVLNSAPNLNILTLSLDGCSSSGSNDAGGWVGLPRLIKAVDKIVCLDVSECLMRDSDLQVVIQSIIYP
jgi:hypothetical protein